MPKYGSIKEISLSFPEALEKVRSGLTSKGFSVLWEIDVKSKIKEKLDKDFSNYMILGACNAKIAFSVLTNQLESGLLLPCNIVVFEHDSRTSVGFLLPTTVLGLTENEKISAIATEAEAILDEIFENIA